MKINDDNTKTLAANFLLSANEDDLTIADIIIALDKEPIYSEQDYATKTTTWTFPDFSAIRVHRSKIEYIDLNNQSKQKGEKK